MPTPFCLDIWKILHMPQLERRVFLCSALGLVQKHNQHLGWLSWVTWNTLSWTFVNSLAVGSSQWDHKSSWKSVTGHQDNHHRHFLCSIVESLQNAACDGWEITFPEQNETFAKFEHFQNSDWCCFALTNNWNFQWLELWIGHHVNVKWCGMVRRAVQWSDGIIVGMWKIWSLQLLKLILFSFKCGQPAWLKSTIWKRIWIVCSIILFASRKQSKNSWNFCLCGKNSQKFVVRMFA